MISQSDKERIENIKRKSAAQERAKKRELENIKRKAFNRKAVMFLIVLPFFIFGIINIYRLQTYNNVNNLPLYSPYPQMSDEQYNDCVELGKNVMSAREQTIPNSRNYEESKNLWDQSYYFWEQHCSYERWKGVINLDLYSFPMSPLEWARLK